MILNVIYMLLAAAVGALLFYLISKPKWQAVQKDLDSKTMELEQSKVLIEENKQLFGKVSALEARNDELSQRIALLQLNEQQQETIFRKIITETTHEGLVKQGKVLTEQQEKTLNDLLNPLRERIRDFEKKVEDSHKESQLGNTRLFEQIKSLTELNQTVTQKTSDLTNALKGSNKMQGSWGEMILERVLESSGLQKGREYETQFSDRNLEGETIRPDAVIYLPNEKNIIIDAKVSLTAYEAYTSAADGTPEKDLALKAHLQSLRSHIRLLSEKNYHTALNLNSPDFILMFIPIESGFALSVREDTDLFKFAWEKRIVMVSPSTLLATLRTIAQVWDSERSTRNTIEIAQKAGDMYDKFVAFTEDLKDVGKHIERTQESYERAVNKLSTGKGNLINRSETMKKLGAKATKELKGWKSDDEDEVGEE
jgi:DNA recombination protein RmuC